MYTTRFIVAKREAERESLFKTKGSRVGADIEQFSKEIEETLNNLKSQNIDLVKILPIVSAERYGHRGYSYTEGVIIIGKEK